MVQLLVAMLVLSKDRKWVVMTVGKMEKQSVVVMVILLVVLLVHYKVE